MRRRVERSAVSGFAWLAALALALVQAATLARAQSEELAARLRELEVQGHAKRSETGVEIDLSAAGIGKLLGRGRVDVPLQITVAQASESAVAKVAGAGGKVKLAAASEE